jgi:hypothetical protein
MCALTLSSRRSLWRGLQPKTATVPAAATVKGALNLLFYCSRFIPLDFSIHRAHHSHRDPWQMTIGWISGGKVSARKYACCWILSDGVMAHVPSAHFSYTCSSYREDVL